MRESGLKQGRRTAGSWGRDLGGTQQKPNRNQKPSQEIDHRLDTVHHNNRPVIECHVREATRENVTGVVGGVSSQTKPNQTKPVRMHLVQYCCNV